MESNGSKYINLLSKDLKTKKSGINKKLKYFLLKLVCKNNSLANFQLEEIIQKFFYKKTRSLNILDIGAGLCSFFPENVKDSKNNYFACDLSMDMKNYIDSRGIKFIQSDITKDNLKLENESFDIIICTHLIEHLESPTNLLAESERLLKKSGLLFIKTPDIEKVKWNFYNDYTHIKPYSKKSLIQQVESDCLKIIKCSSTTLYLDFSIKIIKRNPYNPINFIFLFIGIHTFFFRKDMREIICIAKKI